jgi:hypothetical protein
VIEEALGDGGRALHVHAVRAAGEDHHGRVEIRDAFLRRGDENAREGERGRWGEGDDVRAREEAD